MDKSTEQELLIKSQRMQWLNHPHTVRVAKQIKDFRDRMITEAEDASQTAPVDVNSVLGKLNAGYTARKILELITEKE